MAGNFELIRGARGEFLIRLVDAAGDIMAVSGPYRDKAAAVAGIIAFREHAATAFISDRTANRTATGSTFMADAEMTVNRRVVLMSAHHQKLAQYGDRQKAADSRPARRKWRV